MRHRHRTPCVNLPWAAVAFAMAIALGARHAVALPMTDVFTISQAGEPTITFDLPNGVNGGVATVSIVELCPTPLPASWSMMIGGLAVFGFFARRGSKKSTFALEA